MHGLPFDPERPPREITLEQARQIRDFYKRQARASLVALVIGIGFVVMMLIGG